MILCINVASCLFQESLSHNHVDSSLNLSVWCLEFALLVLLIVEKEIELECDYPLSDVSNDGFHH